MDLAGTEPHILAEAKRIFALLFPYDWAPSGALFVGGGRTLRRTGAVLAWNLPKLIEKPSYRIVTFKAEFWETPDPANAGVDKTAGR